MGITYEEQDGVIIRHFTGEFMFDEILESWNVLIERYPNLHEFKGILTDFLDADLQHEDRNLNVLVDFLKNYLDQLKDLKIAIVMDTPMVTNTIIVGQRVKSLQIKPFSTVEAAKQWIEN